MTNMLEIVELFTQQHARVFARERLNTPAEFITIAYTEIPADEWKKVWDKEIEPNVESLLRKPEYEM